jgi:hypothetical protein
MKEELKRVFSAPGAFDLTAIDKVKQRDNKIFEWIKNCPDDDEMTEHLHKLGNDKSGANAKCPVEYYKALYTDAEGRSFLFDALEHYWTSGSWDGEYEPRYKKPPPTELPAAAKDAIAYLQENNWRISWAPNTHRSGSKVATDYAKIANTTTIIQALECGATLHQLAIRLTKNDLLPHDPAHEPDLTDNLPLKDDASGVVYPEWEVARLNLFFFFFFFIE